MSLSEWFEDSDVVNQLRSFFDENERESYDFYSFFSQIDNYDEDYFSLLIKDRRFLIHKITGLVSEVEL